MSDSPQSGAELLARIKPRLNEDWREIVLRPDLAVELEEADSELMDSRIRDAAAQPAEAEKRMGTKPAGDSPATVELAERVEELRQAMIASAVRFTFRALPRNKFRSLCDSLPPRKDDQYDAFAGYNRQALADSLVRASLIDPVFDDADWDTVLQALADGTFAAIEAGRDWRQLVDLIGPGQWEALLKLAESVNGSVVHDVPKSPLASEVLSPRASTSAPQPASE